VLYPAQLALDGSVLGEEELHHHHQAVGVAGALLSGSTVEGGGAAYLMFTSNRTRVQNGTGPPSTW
jgi:hypothetical protein